MQQNNADTRNIKRGKRPPKKITERYLHNAGLAYLQRFAASSGHFRTVMMRKIDRSCRHHTDQDRTQCIETLESLIEKFLHAGLLDDEAYTRGMVHSLRRRGLPARLITAKLQQKNVPSGLIKSALEENGDSDLLAAVRFARRKKLGPYDHDNKKPYDKSLAAMGRSGFGYDIARKTLEMSPEEAENILSHMEL